MALVNPKDAENIHNSLEWESRRRQEKEWHEWFTGDKQGRTYSLTGMTFCGCGRNILGSHDRYVCPSTSARAPRAPRIEPCTCHASSIPADDTHDDVASMAEVSDAAMVGRDNPTSAMKR